MKCGLTVATHDVTAIDIETRIGRRCQQHRSDVAVHLNLLVIRVSLWSALCFVQMAKTKITLILRITACLRSE